MGTVTNALSELVIHQTDDTMMQRKYSIGAIDFLCSCDLAIAKRQFAYLDHYIPDQQGDGSLGALHIRTIVDDSSFSQIYAILDDLEPEQYIEPFDGVIYAVYQDGARTWYRPVRDANDNCENSYLICQRPDGRDIILHRATPIAERHTLRVMRDIVLRTYENAGGLIFHAASVTLDAGAIMLCGKMVAGKTTLLTMLLRDVHAHLLSNDRVVLTNNDPLTVVGIPMPVRAGRGTIYHTPELSAYIANQKLTRAQSAILTCADLDGDFGSRSKVEFSPFEYASALQTDCASSGQLRAIIFPRLSNDAAPVWYREVAHAEALAHLQESCFTPHDDSWLKPWMVERIGTDEELERYAADVCTRLAQSMPVVELGFGVQQPMDEVRQRIAAIAKGLVA